MRFLPKIIMLIIIGKKMSTLSFKLVYHMLMIDWHNDHWRLCISVNLEMTDELQVMFQPQNWHSNIFGSEPLTCFDHCAISHLLVGNCGEYWGPNVFLVKTGHTTAAIKLEGMLRACLVIPLSVSVGLHLSRLLLERQNERQALVHVLRVSPHWTLRAKLYVCEWMLDDEGHLEGTRSIFHRQDRSKSDDMIDYYNFFSFSLSIFVYLPFLSVFGQLIKSTNLIRACLKRSSGASRGEKKPSINSEEGIFLAAIISLLTAHLCCLTAAQAWCSSEALCSDNEDFISDSCLKWEISPGLPKVRYESHLRWLHEHMTKTQEVWKFIPIFGQVVYSGFYTWETCKVFDFLPKKPEYFLHWSAHMPD